MWLQDVINRKYNFLQKPLHQSMALMHETHVEVISKKGFHWYCQIDRYCIQFDGQKQGFVKMIKLVNV